MIIFRTKYNVKSNTNPSLTLVQILILSTADRSFDHFINRRIWVTAVFNFWYIHQTLNLSRYLESRKYLLYHIKIILWNFIFS